MRLLRLFLRRDERRINGELERQEKIVSEQERRLERIRHLRRERRLYEDGGELTR